MLDKYEIRRLNLLRLKREQCGDNATRLAERIGRANTYVSRMLYPEGKAGKKRIAEDMAEVIEKAFSLPKGWLDGQDKNNVEPGPAIKGRIPLISWVQAGSFCEAVDLLLPGDAERWMDCPRDHSPSTYALRVRGPSMEPRFYDGEIIMVDPAAQADSGRFVIAKKTGSQEATFKQLVIDGGDTYLKAMNPQWPEPIIRIDEEWIICGVVICKVELF
jgi:SOS-response transcriptional repressor LexA